MSYQYKWLKNLDDVNGWQLISLYNDALKTGTFLGYSAPLEGDAAKSKIDLINQQLFAGNIHLFAVFDGTEMVATATLNPSVMANCSHITEISKGIVRSDYQGTGLLIDAFREVALYCREKGFEQLTLDVRENSKPHKIWGRLGFVEYGRMADYARVDDVKCAGVFMEQSTRSLLTNLDIYKQGSVTFDRHNRLIPKEEFKKALRDELEAKITMTHPIIKEVLANGQNWELLRFMTLQGYQLTKHFLEYVETLFFHCPQGIHKRRLMFNMFEEETGMMSKTQNHVTLMENFIKAIGISDEERDAAVALPSTQELIDYRMNLVRNKHTFHMGAAAVLVGSEGQNLETAAGEARHDLLPRVYGLTEKDLRFFSVHQQEDVAHVREGIEVVADVCTTPRMQQEALQAVRTTCDLFYGMYEGIANYYRTAA